MKTRKNDHGFTLVELAIVLVIIGLLIGGILKGQELIKNAAVSATAAQLKSFESAYTTFLDIYGAKPGDFSRANSKIATCTVANRCRNGDGNNWIRDAYSAVRVPGDTDEGAVGEIYQALKHLAAANLIGGVNISAAPGPQTDALVSAKSGGFFYIGELMGHHKYHRGGGDTFTPSGIYVSNAGNYNWGPTTGYVLTPAELERLDRKIDDGVPGSGSLFAMGRELCVSGAVYNVLHPQKECAFIYKIR